jgi:hypothetical protein
MEIVIYSTHNMNDIPWFARDTKVKDKFSGVTGKVASAPFEGNREGEFFYMVALDCGRYCEKKELYLSHIVVHNSNLVAVR